MLKILGDGEDTDNRGGVVGAQAEGFILEGPRTKLEMYSVLPRSLHAARAVAGPFDTIDAMAHSSLPRHSQQSRSILHIGAKDFAFGQSTWHFEVHWQASDPRGGGPWPLKAPNYALTRRRETSGSKSEYRRHERGVINRQCAGSGAEPGNGRDVEMLRVALKLWMASETDCKPVALYDIEVATGQQYI